MQDGSFTLFYKQDVDKVTFDLYLFPLQMIPQLVSQLQTHFMMENEKNSRGHFQDERAINALRAGISPEKQMSLNLKLKNY